MIARRRAARNGIGRIGSRSEHLSVPRWIERYALLESGHAGRVYEITGPDLLDFDQIAAILTEHIGRPLRYLPRDDASFKAGAIQAGLPAVLADYMPQVYHLIKSGAAGRTTDVVTRSTGRPPRSLEESLQAYPSS